jgi:hypothetical protein
MAHNFEQALRLMEAALTDCPDDLWQTDLWPDEAPTAPAPHGGLHGSAPWFLGYHALTTLDYDLTGEFEPWAPPQPFDDNTYAFPNRKFTKPELLGYVDWCRGRVRQTLDGLTEEMAARPLPSAHRYHGMLFGVIVACRCTSLSTPPRSVSSSPPRASQCNPCPVTVGTRVDRDGDPADADWRPRRPNPAGRSRRPRAVIGARSHARVLSAAGECIPTARLALLHFIGGWCLGEDLMDSRRPWPLSELGDQGLGIGWPPPGAATWPLIWATTCWPQLAFFRQRMLSGAGVLDAGLHCLTPRCPARIAAASCACH